MKHFQRLKQLDSSKTWLKQSQHLQGVLQQRVGNLKIRDKLNLGFGVLVGLTFLVVGRSSLSSLQATSNIHQTREVRMPTALVSANAQTNLLKMLSDVRGYLATGESEFRDRYQHSRQDFEEELSELEGLLQNHSGNVRRLNELQQTYEEWEKLPDRLFVLRDNLLENQPALQLLDQDGEVPIAQIQAKADQILQEQKNRSPSETNTALLADMVSFRSSFALLVASLRAYLVTRDPAFRFEYAAQLKANQVAWNSLQNQQDLLTATQRSHLLVLAQSYQQFLPLPQQMFAVVESDRYREDLFIFQSEAEPLAESMLRLLDEVVASQQNALTAELQAGSESLETAQWQTLLLGMGALALGTSMTLILRRQIADPVKRLTEVTTRIMEGEWDARADVESRDEIGMLAHTFNQMTDSLQKSQQALEEYSHSLEERVDLRTQELQEKNQQLAETLLHLQQTQAQLIQTEKMSSLGQLVAGVAHEINNPVNFIHGNILHASQYTTDLLDLLKLYQKQYPAIPPEIDSKVEEIDLEFLQEDLPKLLKSMRVGAERIHEIVRSLRVFSRLDEADVKEVNIHEGIDSTLLILHNRLKAKPEHPEIEVIKDYADLPLVECYAGQLNQVFMNVLSNAIDAIEEWYDRKKTTSTLPSSYIPQIHISTQVKDKNWVSICIADNGPGIPPAILSRLFDPFFTTKAIGKGTGLGMSISHQIVTEKHRGLLFCRSTPGEGAEFTIEIPIRQIEQG